jgi:hypothetical protein
VDQSSNSNQAKKPVMKCWFRLNTMQHHANKNKEKLDTRPPIAPKILPNEENKKLTHGAR